MIKSMTGFGRAEIQDEERKITVEIKAVNHRYLDFNIKMPKKFSFFETAVRNVLKEYMQRGKVDVMRTIPRTVFLCSTIPRSPGSIWSVSPRWRKSSGSGMM